MSTENSFLFVAIDICLNNQKEIESDCQEYVIQCYLHAIPVIRLLHSEAGITKYVYQITD